MNTYNDDDDELMKKIMEESLQEHLREQSEIPFGTVYKYFDHSTKQHFYSLQSPSESSTDGIEYVNECIENVLKSTRDQPMCFCIVPSLRTWNGYKPFQSLLHVGISDSQGNVYNFDSYLKREQPWEKAIGIPIVVNSCSEEQNLKLFDHKLQSFHDSRLQLEKNNKYKYHQLDNNCYDYIIDCMNNCLNLTNHGENKNSWNKNDLVEQVLLKPIDQFENYANIVLNLLQTDRFYVNPE